MNLLLIFLASSIWLLALYLLNKVMKKLNHRITMIAIILMAMLLFTACGNADEQLTAEELTTNGRYNFLKPSYTSSKASHYTANNYEVFTNPVSLRFYQEQEALINSLAENEVALFQLIFREEPPTGG
ncbi:hypothetical protein Amet_1849 [Alkaliphilus metalliredigens QYMF]|uniref:Uncharacterized protein n=1 Tax=Alkaliphilus metalliredigens (strain QYMF) TaxID=293826 RepID=A6TPA1_ALKMQ|nr:hypothetical protein [Alkaliphilus metalliredigens]ABR48019.1 hypothetical protein Amet_1849 [Alkaliphilus metalliredigens QYMF]